MAKLDRLGWADGWAVASYGCRLGVRTNAPALLPRLRALLPPGSRRVRRPTVERLYSLRVSPRPGAAPRYTLLVGSLRLAQSADLEEVLEVFESHVQAYVAEHARRHVFVHAGVVGWRGQAIVIPGHSMSGKTTLVAELVLAGATYYSDEYAVIDRAGRVHPFARPLAIRDPATQRQRNWPVAALGGRPGRAPLPAGLVVLTGFAPGVDWAPRAVSPGQGALGLLAHTVAVRHQPGVTLATLRQFVSGATVVEGARGDALPTAAAILALLDAAPQPALQAS